MTRTVAVGGVLAASVAAGLTLAAIAAIGAGSANEMPLVRTEKRRVTVNGENPSIWIVDDGLALGGLLFGRDIRGFYRQNPGALPVGYVKRVDDLPERGVRRLVLAGRAGDDFLRKVCSDPAARGLPPEVIFISPPFPPQAVPAVVLRQSRVRLYVGEFATWYSDSYDRPADWVRIVPSAALYLPDWMSMATAPDSLKI